MKPSMPFMAIFFLLGLGGWAASAADYLTEIKPLLERKCYACHGAFQQQGGLRVDTAASLLKGGESENLIVPKNADESLLIEVLTGEAGFRMPPEKDGAPLTEEEIQLVRDWINTGAPLPEHEEPQADPRTWWSYQPITRPDVPDSNQTDWARNEIDRFIAAARQSRELPTARQATKAVWLRRVYLDLIGLPPTREELHAFVNDPSDDAFERVVNDLLSRPQYGERWGRHWMDVWRYSDWYGSRGINEIRYSQRHIWRWRDWIVQSLNEDKGYDQMIREMLAADEICDGDPSVLPATGFLGRNWYKFDRNVWMFETVERTGEAFLGLTLRCCRCHDHKFDPVTQKEYYQFRAFFEPHNVRTDPLSAMTETENDATLGQVLTDGIPLVYDKDLEAATYLFERGDSRYPDKEEPLSPAVPFALGGSVDVQSVDLPVQTWYPSLRSGVHESLLEKSQQALASATKKVEEADFEVTQAEAKLVSAKTDQQVTSPELFLHDEFSALSEKTWKKLSGDWKVVDGKLVQSAVTSFATIVTQQELTGDFRIELKYRALEPGTYRSVGFSFDYIDQGNSQDIYTSTGDSRQSVQAFHRINGKQVYPKAGIVPTTLQVGEDVVFDVSVIGSKLTIDLNGERKLDYAMPEKRRNGKFALWVHQGAAEFLDLKITKLGESMETLQQHVADAQRAIDMAKAEEELARAELDSLQKRLTAEMAKFTEESEQPFEQLKAEAIAAEKEVNILSVQLAVLKATGNAEQIKEAEDKVKAVQSAELLEYTPVGEQFPQQSTGRRTALASWIASADNPRTARVAVNHIWMRHFGRPLVATPENFGLNGRRPTHPELLDWLAAELIANNWQMKPLHKQIVLSATYRMSSSLNDVPEAKREEVNQDPNNQYFWRMNARRMEAEVVRDATLALSGQLDETMGGKELPEADGEKVFRRSLYFRNTPNEKMEMLEAFDVADPNACYRRKESIVPQQSLAMMNSGLTQDAARLIALQLADAEDFVTAAFETVINRPPSAAEHQRCKDFLTREVELPQSESERFSAGGTATRPPAIAKRLRAQENLVHVLFLHNDFVTIR